MSKQITLLQHAIVYCHGDMVVERVSGCLGRTERRLVEGASGTVGGGQRGDLLREPVVLSGEDREETC